MTQLRKINHILPIFFLLFLLVGITIAEDPKFEFKYSEEEATLYRMTINPITPTDGIWRGHAIAYGHYIKRPYNFEIREDTLLFVNNVRIYPPLTSQVSLVRRAELEEKSHDSGYYSKPYTTRLNYILDNAKMVFKEMSLKENRDAALDSVYKLFKNDSLLKGIIIDCRIYPTGKNDATISIKLNLPGFGLTPYILQFYLNQPDTGRPVYKNKKEEISSKKADVENLKNEFRNNLNEGKILLVSSFRGWPFIVDKLNKKTKDIIEIISFAKSSSEIQNKLDSLYLIDPEKEILYNYNSNEWPSLETLKFE